MMKMSLIIPMYNVEKFIGKCLTSVLRQGEAFLSQVEVILVNDGSHDNSLLEAKKYEYKFPHIRFIDQSNQGLSAARNAGLDHATGEYIWFVDSDDWIADNALQLLFQKIENGDPDIIHFRAINCFGEELRKRDSDFPDISKEYAGTDILKLGYWSTCSPFYIYKRQFLLDKDLRFFPGIFHEDNEFTPRLLFFAKKVQLMNDVLYFVYQNTVSITRSPNPKKSFDLIKVAHNLYWFCKCNVKENDLVKSFYRFISLCLNNALYGTKEMNQHTQKLFEKELQRNKSLFHCLRHSGKAKYVLEGYLFLFSTKYVAIYKKLCRLK